MTSADSDFMIPYPKINTLYKRTEGGRIIPGVFARPEFELLYNVTWLWTEKVDGTNIRLGYDPDVEIGPIAGRTDRAQIPPPLLTRLTEIQRDTQYRDVFDCPVTLYGEGYGAGIQKGGVYRDSPDFVLFDVQVGRWWLDYPDVVDVAVKLGLDSAPLVTVGDIPKAEKLVMHENFSSAWGDDFTPEGLVGRPATTLFNKAGQRILCKIKDVDYRRLREEKV